MALIERSICEFTEELSSKSPVPGGGGAAALAGALGIALGNMVGALTVGKKKYVHVESQILELNRESGKLRVELLELIAADAAAFQPLSQAYGIPKDDPDREQVMEAALTAAVKPPLDIMKSCAKALELIAAYARIGSVIAISDAGCAAALCRGALDSAALNVYINTKSMKDREKAAALNAQVAALLAEYRQKAQTIYDEIAGRLEN